MPQPVPVPEVAELVTVAEIGLWTYEEAASLVAADSTQEVSDAKWAATLLDIALWPTMRYETGDVKKVGSIEFFEDAANQARLDFRNTLRIRYNQPLLTSEIPADAGLTMGISSQAWSGSSGY